MSACENVIRIAIDPELPEAFKDELSRAITTAIRVVSHQYFGHQLSEEEIEIFIGDMYQLKWKLEGRR